MDNVCVMLTSSTRIAIAFWLIAGIAMVFESVRLLVRVKKTLPVVRTLSLALLLVILGAGRIVYADELAYTTWYYLANIAGVLLVVGGATYGAAMQRSRSFRDVSQTTPRV